ncbi:MAG: HD domain-containing protein [Clostridiales bacterium]|nr:HD domain-containing protein [Clostridiales bacterium]
MTIARIMDRMLAFSGGNLHDIHHFMKVWTYARTIGQLEGLDEETLLILEAAAIVHDIGCPLCREKYGHCNAREQEMEGMPLAQSLLASSGLTDAQIQRVVTLVGRHHTLEGIDGPDCQILIEADYLVNAGESGYDRESMRRFAQQHFQTSAGRALMASVYSV